MRARVVAPVLAAVLGIAGGVTTALVTAPGDSPSPAATSDPLGIGIPLVDQDCTMESISVLGYGDDAAALSSPVANAEAEGTTAHYLRTADSCDTAYGPSTQPPPDYVVYAGPYAGPGEPCEIRMDGGGRRGSVTRLRSGNEDFVKCSCALPDSAGPVLRVGEPSDDRTVAWTRLLQVMLHDDDSAAFPGSAVTGRYDAATASRVATYQASAPGKRTTPGVVDTTTWGVLNERLCKNYSW